MTVTIATVFDILVKSQSIDIDDLISLGFTCKGFYENLQHIIKEYRHLYDFDNGVFRLISDHDPNWDDHIYDECIGKRAVWGYIPSSDTVYHDPGDDKESYFNNRLYLNACCHGLINIVEYLNCQDKKVNRYCFYATCKMGKLDMAKFLHKKYAIYPHKAQGTKSDLLSLTVDYEHLDVAYWLESIATFNKNVKECIEETKMGSFLIKDKIKNVKMI